MLPLFFLSTQKQIYSAQYKVLGEVDYTDVYHVTHINTYRHTLLPVSLFSSNSLFLPVDCFVSSGKGVCVF